MNTIYNMNQVVIAIDGYVATGKGTTARLVAERLWWLCLDTGAMYRAATYLALRDGWIEADDEEKGIKIQQYTMEFYKNPETNHDDMRVDGENIESYIRTTEIGFRIKDVMAGKPLRRELCKKQRIFADVWPLVAEWRDMGTVVFPDAQRKFFLVCDIAARVERRYQQLLQWWKNPDRTLIRQEILFRDEADYLWPNAVNKRADDAIVIDTSDLTIEEQVEQILGLINSDKFLIKGQ